MATKLNSLQKIKLKVKTLNIEKMEILLTTINHKVQRRDKRVGTMKNKIQ
jgi:hypothetical protein